MQVLGFSSILIGCKFYCRMIDQNLVKVRYLPVILLFAGKSRNLIVYLKQSSKLCTPATRIDLRLAEFRLRAVRSSSADYLDSTELWIW
jgi:hypothetical protein